jgi:hypothetical protein
LVTSAPSRTEFESGTFAPVGSSPPDDELGVADRCGRGQVGGTEPVAGAQHGVADRHVFAGGADVRARPGASVDPDALGRGPGSGGVVGVLDGDDRVRSLGERCAGHDALCRAGSERVRLAAGRDVSGDRQCDGRAVVGGEVRRAHGEPVHRGVREGRDGRERGEVRGEHAVERVCEADRLVWPPPGGGQQFAGGEDAGQVGLDGGGHPYPSIARA